MTKETESYRIFDGGEESFTPVQPTNANIRSVLEVPVQAAFKTDEERLYYAQEGDIPPDHFDEDNNPHYTFSNIYMQGSYWPALAQRLFYDCDDIVTVKDQQVKVLDEDRYEIINRGEVRRAFNEFLGKFGATPYEVRSLLNVWDNAQIRGILQKLREMKDGQDRIGTMNMPSIPGDPESLSDTDSGKA